MWFFAFEGTMGAVYDLWHAWHGAWTVVLALVALNIAVGFTVLGRRAKLVRAMLKNSRTRKIAIGLIALRVGVHLLLGAIGLQITSSAGHLVMAASMAVVTVALLWFDQRIAFRALGIDATAR
ncbi:hypothetical protein [Streptantibioticus cattleyicolor]|uniref:Uncharacterized protein n=1 Tax=Streptantibioticus cattleyicolor (strain ATCC 35852 / DSM 46488 / JCM 4925 / NBRC 14057 / NRRL 8057) TaxID=1003195 RepID=F8JIX6_STREN|nr:hypothetical protein [Streptantibioticus cattleyicolor]AEW98938.1 hypothetical protein SCATT_p07450 [Streptantibioticus cattleyicolor NRRL 8057 = DSM 46488]CCB72015.1 membrane protein of unknown function [Streptantibioticus cattleyicolor NRRL 8057 = DSM 46488]